MPASIAPDIQNGLYADNISRIFEEFTKATDISYTYCIIITDISVKHLGGLLPGHYLFIDLVNHILRNLLLELLTLKEFIHDLLVTLHSSGYDLLEFIP